MPTVLLIDGFRFFFYSNEHLPRHVQVEFAEGVVKFSLEPVALIKSKRLSSKEIRKMRTFIVQYQEILIEKWDEYFNR